MYLPTYLSTYFLKDHYFGRNETFKDLQHGCMHEQAVLMKQLSGSYLLKTVEKKLGLLQALPKVHAQVDSKNHERKGTGQ